MHPCSFDSQGLLCWFPEVMATVNGFSCRRRLSRTRVAVAISICWANARAQKLGRVSPERCKDFFPGMRITQMSYISMLYKVYIYISSLLIFQVGWNLGWSSFEKSSLCGLDELWPVWLTVQAARCWAAAVWDIWGGRKWSFMKLCLFAYGYGFMGFLLDD